VRAGVEPRLANQANDRSAMAALTPERGRSRMAQDRSATPTPGPDDDAMRTTVPLPRSLTEWSESSGRQALAVLAYFGLYLAWLFATLEGEMVHWLTLVALPFALVWLTAGPTGGESSLAVAFRSVGLARGNLATGLAWAAAAGLSLGGMQVLVSQRRVAVWEVIQAGSFVYLLPLTFALLLLTAAFTEEFFFRGVLQTRLARWSGSHLAAVALTSVLFGLYHLPYALLNPRWPSYGDPPAALAAAMGQGIVGGLILGFVFVRARGNLLAPILVHALINSVPGMVLVDGMLKR
jgi:membrane protease YdiL (CAAX protease family)